MRQNFYKEEFVAKSEQALLFYSQTSKELSRTIPVPSKTLLLPTW